MPIIKTRPIDRIINGQIITSSEVSLVSEPYYDCSGESVIIVKNIDFSKIRLNSTRNDRITIKALTRVLLLPDFGKIDEIYDEMELENGASVELVFAVGNWYILSSDGLKQS
jgi:hypothetical protein